MKKLCMALIGIMIGLLSNSCAYAIRYEGIYEGKVIDAETNTPIEGVVVLGTWSKAYTGPGGAVYEFYDATETVTDKNGDFSIDGRGFEVMSNVTPMNIFIFKAGYEYESGSWSSLKKYAKKIKWEGDKAIISLKKMTIEERRKRGTPSRPSIPVAKMRLLTKEINKERVALGWPPFELPGDDK